MPGMFLFEALIMISRVVPGTFLPDGTSMSCLACACGRQSDQAAPCDHIKRVMSDMAFEGRAVLRTASCILGPWDLHTFFLAVPFYLREACCLSSAAVLHAKLCMLGAAQDGYFVLKHITVAARGGAVSRADQDSA